MEINQKEIINNITNWAEEKKAENIVCYDVKEKSDYTDSIIICHGTNDLHVKAIAENIIDHSKEHKIRLYAVEGLENAKWILLDFIDIIVHVFNETTRNYYKLEELWNINSKNIKEVSEKKC